MKLKEIRSKGVKVDEKNLIISEAANLILPFHREMDEIREMLLVKLKLEQREEVLDQLMKIKLEEDQ